MAMTEEQYRADQAAQQNLTTASMAVSSQSVPIPTQEELDLMRLGLMHPDEKADPDNPEMPSVHVQRAYLDSVSAAIPAPVPAPTKRSAARPAAPAPAAAAVPRRSEPEVPKPR